MQHSRQMNQPVDRTGTHGKEFVYVCVCVCVCVCHANEMQPHARDNHSPVRATDSILKDWNGYEFKRLNNVLQLSRGSARGDSCHAARYVVTAVIP